MFAIMLLSFVCSVSFIWSLPFLLTSYFGWRIYEISEIDKIMLISSKILLSSTKNDDNKPRGIFIGYYYIGVFIRNKNDEPMILMISNEKSFNELVKRETLNISLKEEIIIYYERSSNYHWLRYSKRSLVLDTLKYIPSIKQNDIMIKIIEEFNDRNYCTAFVQGEPGSGKSMTSIFLCNKLNGSLIRTFNPCDPGDTISSLYNQVNPTKNNPLILVLDEFDILLNKIHNNLVIPHKNISIQITDKISWNRFFDDINLGLYPYMIVILTSNHSHKSLEEMYDPSYVRNGRIHVKYVLEK